MVRRHGLCAVLSAAVLFAGLSLTGCQTQERPQSLTGQVNENRAPRYKAHSKGQQWGHIEYDR